MRGRWEAPPLTHIGEVSMLSKAVIWRGLQAIRLIGGEYEATVLPQFGANCISLIHKPSGSELLRVPSSAAELRNGLNVYGLPLLFPPNRIQDGKFTFEGREYVFPVNEPERGNHIHGFISGTEFAYAGGGAFEYEATESKPYLSFPHAFLLRREYLLDGKGLYASVTVTNNSGHTMPVGVGIHAALRAEPDEDCRLQAEALCRWNVDEKRLLTTGEMTADEPLIEALRKGTLCPDIEPISALLEYRAGSEIVLMKRSGAWHCAPDPSFRFIMLWNGSGKDGFVCPEPQSCMTDAPNLPLPREVTGLCALAPGDTAVFGLRYYFMPSGQ